MKTFTELSTSSVITNKKNGDKIKIIKLKKDGTKRVFFQPFLIEGNEKKPIVRTLYARLYDAEKTAQRYIDYVNNKPLNK